MEVGTESAARSRELRPYGGQISITLFTQLSRADVHSFFETKCKGAVAYSERSCDIRIQSSATASWEISDFFEIVCESSVIHIRRSECRYGSFAVTYDGDIAVCCYEQRDGVISCMRIFCWCDETANAVSQSLAGGCEISALRLALLVSPDNVRVCRISDMQYMHFTIHSIAGWYLYNMAVVRFEDKALCHILSSIQSNNLSIGDERSIIEFVTSVKNT